jgi:hypothetical protein
VHEYQYQQPDSGEHEHERPGVNDHHRAYHAP